MHVIRDCSCIVLDLQYDLKCIVGILVPCCSYLYGSYRWRSFTDVIDKVHRLADQQNMPTMPNGPVFEWRRGLPILPPVADDNAQDDTDDSSVTESVASAAAANPPTLYVDNDRSISSAYTDVSDEDRVPGANYRAGANDEAGDVANDEVVRVIEVLAEDGG